MEIHDTGIHADVDEHADAVILVEMILVVGY